VRSEEEWHFNKAVMGSGYSLHGFQEMVDLKSNNSSVKEF
jgi:hypothetical protein